MRVHMLRNPGRHITCDLKEGDIGTVDKELGESLIQSGIAEPVAETSFAKKTKIEAVPEKPAIKGE